MKKFLLSLFFLSIAILLTFFFVYSQAKPVSQDTGSKYFLILKGSSASKIANDLKDAGLIKNPILFRVYTHLSGFSQKIQAGQYKLSPNMSFFKMLSEINKGPIEVWITIPEGLRREQVVEKYINVLQPPDSEKFRNEFMELTANKEGYLFPDTYLFPWDATPKMIVDKMLSIFEEKIGDITFEEVIIASLLERETVNDVEKGIVAGILYKRLKNGWPLQVDATIQYASATLRCQGGLINCDWWQEVTKEDLNLASKFNTYKFTGLPPAPISGSGLTSLKAAINPEDSPYWFYIHDSEGIIHYARTVEEHNANIGRYLK